MTSRSVEWAAAPFAVFVREASLPMASSQRLRVKDLSRLYRLLGECSELGADPLAWRRHLAEQLPVLVGGQVGLYSELTIVAKPFDKPHWLVPRVFLDHGWPTPSDRRPWEEHIAGGRPEEGPHVTPDVFERTLKTGHLSGDLGRSNWLESDFFHRWVKTCHLDDGLHSHHSLDDKNVRWLFVSRALGDRQFNRRERLLMSVLNVELARLFGTQLARMDEPSVSDLPPRLRQVLICLMEGDGEKQVVLRLGLSRHTVHDYVKQLHLRFGVRSRGELLARSRDFWPVLEWLESGGGSLGVEQSATTVRTEHTHLNT